MQVEKEALEISWACKYFPPMHAHPNAYDQSRSQLMQATHTFTCNQVIRQSLSQSPKI